jgi:hypothetical protein
MVKLSKNQNSELKLGGIWIKPQKIVKKKNTLTRKGKNEIC